VLNGLPPIEAKLDPEIFADVTLTVLVPVFVNVSVCIALLPTEMFPKVNVVALPVRIPEPGVAGLPALVNPAQLERPTIASSAPNAARMANGPLCFERFRPRCRSGF